MILLKNPSVFLISSLSRTEKKATVNLTGAIANAWYHVGYELPDRAGCYYSARLITNDYSVNLNQFSLTILSKAFVGTINHEGRFGVDITGVCRICGMVGLTGRYIINQWMI